MIEVALICGLILVLCGLFLWYWSLKRAIECMNPLSILGYGLEYIYTIEVYIWLGCRVSSKQWAGSGSLSFRVVSIPVCWISLYSSNTRWQVVGGALMCGLTLLPCELFLS